jgi:hypothetical protein
MFTLTHIRQTFNHRIMKNASKITFVFSLLVGVVFILSYCRQDDTILGQEKTTAGNELLSLKVATAPSIDGTIDRIWEDAAKLTVETQVPNPGNYLFAGYIGTTYNVSLRSLYDNDNIYFLVEWNDPTESLVDRPWYFNPTTKAWAREANSPVFNANGVKTRDAFNEDKFGMLWNISTYDFTTKTCYASCHLNVSSIDPVTGKTLPATGGNHFTTNANERIDMWHYHLMKDQQFGQLSDEYQDWNAGAINGNGRHTDTQLATTDGPVTNTQTLTITGKTTTMAVPKWVVPDAANRLFILTSETTSGVAKQVTAVDSNGVLTYNGGTIDPNIGTDYQQIGSGDGPKVIASTLISPMTGNRADITAKSIHNGSGWVMEIKRALKTGDTDNQDVDFSSLNDQPFGIATFGQANIAHALKPNLLLKFKK